MKTRHLILMALLSTVIILTGCEKKEDPEFKIQIVGNHDLIPGEHCQLNVLKMRYIDQYCDGESWSSTYKTLNNSEIQWEIESPEILSIDSCGMITAHKYGETRVTAYYAPCNSTYTTTIKVGEYLDFSPFLVVFNGREFWSIDNDAVFNLLIEKGVDKDKDGKISAEEIHQVEELECSDFSSNLHFPFLDVCTNLKKIKLYSRENYVDFSYNPLLEHIEVAAYHVTISSKNSKIESLTIHQAQTVHLDLSTCDNLKFIALGHCSRIEYLDLSGCTKLEYLDYYGAVAKPYTFDCRNCPNLLYVNINELHDLGNNYGKNCIRLDPFFYHYYSENPKRGRTQAEKDELAYNGGLSELFPWSSNIGQSARNVIVNYEWYFNATLIQ